MAIKKSVRFIFDSTYAMMFLLFGLEDEFTDLIT
jgi:hypothetical protein